MCGIIGYVGPRPAIEVILPGLRRLEYRGYDSAGVAVLEGGELQYDRAPGRLSVLEGLLAGRPREGTVGVGHTRWATHGEPTEANAHPHLDCTGRFALVHNGIIENHAVLKDRLVREGHRFGSYTDTEVIVHLVESSYRGDLEAALRAALDEVEGSFAVAVLCRDEPDRIVAARRNSPLIVGLGDGAQYLASDVPAILPYTRKVLYLEEEEMATLTREGVALRRLDGTAVHRTPTTVDWDMEAAEKGGYPHFMLKEIHEQPEAVRATIGGKTDRSRLRRLFGGLGIEAETLQHVERVVVVACGTAWHAGLVGKCAIEDLAGIPTQCEIASEFRYGAPVLGRDTLVVAVTQSGETADTLAGVRRAREAGAPVLAVCNVLGSSVPRASEGVFYTHAGPEIGVASTKAYTTQLVAMTLLATYLGLQRGTLDRQRAGRVLRAVGGLPGALREALAADAMVQECARRFQDSRTFFYIGRRYNLPTAFEGALKIKEIAYLHAEGYGAGEMKHGPIALVDPGLTAVAVFSEGATHDKMRSNVEEIRARGGRVVAVAPADDAEAARVADFVLPVPRVDEVVSPVVNVVPLQLLAYHMAVLGGRDVDRPRNLAKSVTVE
ncbi:MAG: glutamine--fructose-6-phosphate transaminase (isomerizing) [Planctomycetes bacterium]|nr:glutamine--fructose-6-phosphate transaminase (isomerizing) [Planctomycetota bacterium]